MKKFFSLLTLVALLLSYGTVDALDVVPGLKGFGTDTRAAYGGTGTPTIYIVDTLNPVAGLENETRNGVSVVTGGLMTILGQTDSNKIILFEVGGTIDGPAYDEWDEYIQESYVTIAGGTAPPPGITLKGIRLAFNNSHDVLVQHIRFRLGDQIKSGEELPWAQVRDCLSINSSGGSDSYNIVLDHNSFSWSLDENVELWTESDAIYNVTISNNIISEGLYENARCALDPIYDDHSKGLILGHKGEIENILVWANLFAHNEDRNPILWDGSSACVNNVVYNPKVWGIGIQQENNINGVRTSLVGNVMIPGNNTDGTDGEAAFWVVDHNNYSYDAWPLVYQSQVYMNDNVCNYCTGDPWNGAKNKDLIVTGTTTLEDVIRVETPPIWPSDFTPLVIAGSATKAYVLAHAGARPTNRDPVDTRIVTETNAGRGANGGGYIDSQQDLDPPGWPDIGTGYRELVIPVNPHANSGDGYTNLEKYIHSLNALVESPTSFPVVNITSSCGGSVSNSYYELKGTATAAAGRTITGVQETSKSVTCTADDASFNEQEEAFTCVMTLTSGVNNMIAQATDSSSETGTDSCNLTYNIPVASTPVVSGGGKVKYPGGGKARFIGR